MSKRDDLFCTCGKRVPSEKNGCSCGRSREQVRQEKKALNRDANLNMMPELPDYLADEPWGAK